MTESEAVYTPGGGTTKDDEKKDLAKAAFDRMDAAAVPIQVEPDQPTTKVIDVPPTNAEAIDAHLDALANQTPGVPTGFDVLDKKIKGLRPGLMVLSAPPGAGKTTFVWQIADQVAAQGTPVLFFSYEMSRGELMNKTLARVSRLDNGQIREGNVGQEFLKDGIDFIKSHGRLIRVVEGDFHLGVDAIRQLVEAETEKAGKAPVVMIDYLQVIPGIDPNLDRRGNVDLVVSELRRIARDLAVPIIAVSSIARVSYATGGASLSAFKESGGIEFTADVAITLEVLKDTSDNSLSPAAIQADFGQRPIKVNIVKNRRGGLWSIPMTYDMAFDEFTVTEAATRLSYLKVIGATGNEG